MSLTHLFSISSFPTYWGLEEGQVWGQMTFDLTGCSYGLLLAEAASLANPAGPLCGRCPNTGSLVEQSVRIWLCPVTFWTPLLLSLTPSPVPPLADATWPLADLLGEIPSRRLRPSYRLGTHWTHTSYPCWTVGFGLHYLHTHCRHQPQAQRSQATSTSD